jgi:galacturonosyltransferase
MNNKKILILANSVNGLYNFRAELIKDLIENNYYIYFSVPQKRSHVKVKLLEKTGAVHIHTKINRRGINPFEDLKLILEYRKIIKNIKPDIVLTYTIKPNIYGNWAASLIETPTIMNVTGIGTSLTTKLKHFIKPLYASACKRAERVFFQNKSNKELFLVNNMVAEDKTILIPGSGVNIDKFKPLEKENHDNKIKFLYIGRVMREKGIEEYLQTAEELKNDYPELEFQLLGNYEEEKYKKIIENNSNVKHLGYSKDVRQEIKEVDCIIHPSYHEGMSNVLLESGAMGKPLIASNIPGCKEIIDDGINGYLFKVKSASSLQDKILKFINLSNEEKIEMGQNSRKKIEREFDRNIVINAYLKEIKNILGN